MIQGAILTKMERKRLHEGGRLGGCWAGEGDLDGALGATCATRRRQAVFPPLGRPQADRGHPIGGDLDGQARVARRPAPPRPADRRCPKNAASAPTRHLVSRPTDEGPLVDFAQRGFHPDPLHGRCAHEAYAFLPGGPFDLRPPSAVEESARIRSLMSGSRRSP